jgi:hypothetical protein
MTVLRAGELTVGQTFETVVATVVSITDGDDGPAAEFSLSTVNAEGKEVMSGYAQVRIAGSA